MQPQTQNFQPQFSTPNIGSEPNPVSISVPHSAPAHLAFASHPLGDMELELSPITSPWLGASPYQPQSDQNHFQTQEQLQTQQTKQASSVGFGTNRGQKRNSKRGASDSGEDGTTSSTPIHGRKRQVAGRSSGSNTNPYALGEGTAKRGNAGSARGTVSAGSTPAVLGRGGRKSNSVAAFEGIADTPSPVDLSMPPPAPPTPKSNANAHPIASSTTSSTLSPVTPSSIMNLGRLGLGSGLSPPLSAVSEQQQSQQSTSTTPQSGGKTNGAKGKGKASTRRASTSNCTSPSASSTLKPLLPGGVPPHTAASLASSPNYTHHLAGTSSSLHILPSTPLPPPLPAVRKTSHKAAEQKRRDSLKTSFDTLRNLLPPLVLPNDESYSGEAPLPGALPPRGPPKGKEGGLNRAVSKLQLLRAGNEYILVLKGRVERRDEYIEMLKKEVRALRAMAMVGVSSSAASETRGRGEEEIRVRGEGGGEEEAEEGRDGDGVEEIMKGVDMVDLELDVDAGEAADSQLRMQAGAIPEGDEADDEDM